MSDWSSFEKDKAYTDQWRTFLTEKNLPKEQEEAVNEGFMDLFKSAEAKDTQAAEVLDSFQQAFVQIFNKVKKRLHPDLVDDISNLDMPSDEEVAATKAPPPAADAPAADAAEDKEEPEMRVAAESIDRTEEFISLLKEVDTFMGVKDGNEQLQAFVTAFVLPFVKAYIEQNNKDMSNFNQAYKNYIQGLGDKEQQFTTRANFIHSVLGGDENKNEYIQDLFFQALNGKVKELPDAQPQAAETTPAEEPNQEPEAEQPNQEPEAEQPNQEPQPEKEASQDKQLTSFSHFFDLYYSTRFGSIPSSGNIKLRSKVIRQLASLLEKGKANDTVLGMFTYLNRIYKQRERRTGAPASEPAPDQPTAASEPTDAAAPDSEAVPDNVIYLSDQPVKGQRQTQSFLKAMRSVDGVTPLELQNIKRAFKDDFEQAKFVVKEGRRKISLTKTINAINAIKNEEARNKIKKLFIMLLQRYKLTADNKDDQIALSSKAPSATASASPEADSPDAEASADEPDASKPESDDDQSDDEEEETPDNVIDLSDIQKLKELNSGGFDKIYPDGQDNNLPKSLYTVIDRLFVRKQIVKENEEQDITTRTRTQFHKTVEAIKQALISTSYEQDEKQNFPLYGEGKNKLKAEDVITDEETAKAYSLFVGLCYLMGGSNPKTEQLRLLRRLIDQVKQKETKSVSESMFYDRMKVLAGIK